MVDEDKVYESSTHCYFNNDDCQGMTEQIIIQYTPITECHLKALR